MLEPDSQEKNSTPRWRRYAPVMGGWAAIIAVFVAGAVIPYPYVIEAPGPTYNVLGKIDGKNAIEISGRQRYEAKGALDMTTVYVSGGPGRQVTGFELVGAWLDPAQNIIEEEKVYPKTATREEISRQSKLEMQDSQSSAVAAALSHEKIPYSSRLVVQGLSDSSPAQGLLKEGDQIVSVSGTPANEVLALRRLLARSEGKPLPMTVRRGSETLNLSLKPKKSGNTWVLGVILKNDFTFPLKATFNLQGVGGPSAGMMYALGLIDELSPGDLTAGAHIAGTGTINAAGQVGPIGGIKQKMIGASQAGARYFLAPAANCGEVVGNIPEGMTVIRVENLGQAVAEVKKIAQQQGSSQQTQNFPTCTK